MRRIRCARCGERWSASKGTIAEWKKKHIKLHKLSLFAPKRGSGLKEEHLKNLERFDKIYFPEKRE